jgi:ribonuclease HI
MNELMLFTDGSVNTRSKIGHGAYLCIFGLGLSQESLKSQVKVRKFVNTSSTKLELQTLLWALSDIQASGKKLIIYTDSQNIIGLRDRQERFEQNNYCSNKGRRLNNYELYQEFFRMTDLLDCEFIGVRGHKPSDQKDEIDLLFSLVDRASRNASRGDR